MKVLLCHNFYQQPGGEDQVFADEAWMLESRGHEVVRYTLHNDAIGEMGRWGLLRNTLWNRRSRRELRALIRRERPALMHCHNIFPLISPSAYSAAAAENVPVVQSLHNYRLLCPAAVFLRAGRACEECLGKFVAWPAVAHACYRGSRGASAALAGMLGLHRTLGTWTRRVARYIAMSEFSRRKFVEGGLPADRIVVKPNFMRSDPGPGDGRGGYAVYVGRLGVEKGVTTLLAAWERLRDDIPLKIVGDGPLADRVVAAAARDPRIAYLGRRAPEEVLSVLGQAACLVLPSLCYENCPKTLVEACAKGTPVVASRLGAMEEMVRDGRTGLLFQPGDAANLADRVRELCAALPAAEMRRAARREYEQNYSAGRNYAMLMGLYQEVLGGARRLPPPWKSAHGPTARQGEPPHASEKPRAEEVLS
jgi:glycosyltransferase involved in cell wall biosynthesis